MQKRMRNCWKPLWLQIVLETKCKAICWRTKSGSWCWTWSKAPADRFKGEVRTINDRNICKRRSCMKNNGKSPTFKFVSGEERRLSEVQRVSRAGASLAPAPRTRQRIPPGSENDWKSRHPELSELESVELELGGCCSDLDKQVSDEQRGDMLDSEGTIWDPISS